MVEKMNMFERGFIASISQVIAQTDFPGLTGAELRRTLLRCGGFQLESGNNKRESLENTLHNLQVKQGAGNIVIRFITEAMNPTLFTLPPEQHRWQELRSQMNAAMAMYGLKVTDQGKVARLKKPAVSLDEVAELTNSLKQKLQQRNCHPTLIHYCSEELVSRSLFHAMSEASKSIPDRIRKMTGLTQDGADLAQAAFGAKDQTPLVAINSLADASDRSEHTGFMNLLIGIHGHFRNPRAHRTRQGSTEPIDEMLDAFSMFSYVHRRLDQAKVSASPNQTSRK